MSATSLNGYFVDELDEIIERIHPIWSSLESANIFITGGTGFFGQWLLAILLRAIESGVVRCEITVLTRSVQAFSKKCPELATASSIRLHEGDVRNFSYPKGQYTHVIHAATDTSQQAEKDPIGMSDTIVTGTRRVLDFAVSQGVRRLLYVSSGAVYGVQPENIERIPEEFTGGPTIGETRSTYGQGKRFAEQMVALYAQQNNIVCNVARCFAFVGPGLPLTTHFAIGNFIADAISGQNISIKGDGTPTRSYLYVADLIGWLLTVLVKGEACQSYNVGSDVAVSMHGLAETVRTTLEAKVEIDVACTINADRCSRYVPDISKAEDELGVRVWTPLDEAIRRTARWAKASTTLHSSSCRPKDEKSNLHEAETCSKTKKFIFDVDGVVASLTQGNDYNLCTPLENNIRLINKLYNAGHYIVMFTARGTETGISWREVTEQQFLKWGLKYHELHFGKPAGDYYVDDKMLSFGELAQLGESLCD